MSTNLPAHFPGCISSLPGEAELRRHLDEVARATDKIAAEREQMNFGQHIAAAVKRRLAPQAASRTAVLAEGDSFGERLRKAVEKKSGQKQHKEQAERERDRYRHLQPRKRTKGE